MNEHLILITGDSKSIVRLRLDLLKEIRRYGWDVTCYAQPSNSYKNDHEVLASSGINLRPLALSRTSLGILNNLISLFRIALIVRSHAGCTFLSSGAKAVTFLGICSRFSQGRRIALLNGLGYLFIPQARLFNRLVSLIGRALYKLSLGGYDALIFHNRDDLADLTNSGVLPGNISSYVVNGSGIDTNVFKYSTPSTQVVFLFVGRLLVDKGIREYLKAASHVRRDFPEFRFGVVGSKDSNPTSISSGELATMTETYGVEYWGELTDVTVAMDRCSIFVLPSYREGLPRATLEALAIGRPVITTDAPGCRETVKDGINGILVPPREWRSLALAMERMGTKSYDDILSMSISSRKLCEEKFDISIVNNQMIEAIMQHPRTVDQYG